jgi:NAD(P)-dependent dehydrogenase (short-subunit alcohol dehydrogenase family)
MAANEPSKAVLITGCSSGIGHATAARLARNGWTVYATARRRDAIADLEPSGCRLLELDVTDEASMAAAVRAVADEAGAVGVLVNNAGYSQSGAIESVSMDDVRRQFETNVFGLARMCQLALPAMRDQGWGRIVNLSSMGGKLTFPGGGYYHATKHAVEALSDALRFEVAGFGVKVVVVEPGAIRTGFADAATTALADVTDESAYAAFNAEVGRATREAYEKGPMKVLGGEADDVAKVIEKALGARNPKPRYTVTPSARVLLGQRAVLSDRMWDRFVGTQFPRPGD